MGPAVFFQYVVIEIFDSKAQARDADLLDSFQLALVEGSGLALEGHLVGNIPADGIAKSVDQPPELGGAQVGWRTPAKIHELKGPPTDAGEFLVELYLPAQCADVTLDLLAVLVRVDPEIAEFAALAAEGNVQVEPKRIPLVRRAFQQLESPGDIVALPEGKGRVVGDEIAADLSRFI